MHACPFRYCFIGIPFVGKELRLSPLAFLGPMFPLIDDVMKELFLILCHRYPVYLL
jgi:hypothetical protein